MEVPWFELYMDEKEQDALVKTLQSKWIGIGPRVKEFEEKVAEYVGVRNAVAVSSGTAALDIALKLLNIEYNDEVIVPGMAYIATVNSVLFQNGLYDREVFVGPLHQQKGIGLPIGVHQKLTVHTLHDLGIIQWNRLTCKIEVFGNFNGTDLVAIRNTFIGFLIFLHLLILGFLFRRF